MFVDIFERGMSDTKEAMERSGFLQVIEIGIPCKFTKEAIIPKYIWDFVEDEVICICRGGERCRLELASEYKPYSEELEVECKRMFGVSYEVYLDIWQKRVNHEIEGKWVKVKMHRIIEGS